MAALDPNINLTEICENVSVLDQKENEFSKKDFQELLEKCQVYLNNKQILAEKDLEEKAGEKETLENEINKITSQIKSLNNQIYQSNLTIKSLGYKITDTEATIEETKEDIEDQKEKVALILQAVYESGEKGALEIFLTSGSISNFFDNFIYFEILNNKNQDLLSEYQSLQAKLSEEKDILEIKKGEQESYIELQEIQKSASQEVKEEQEYLYSITEQEYQQSLDLKEDVESKRAEVEKRLIQLVGLLPGQEQPDFGTLLNIAKTVGPKVGVRPAFILAIIRQESNLGKNVGRCYITNSATGGGIYANGNLINRIIRATLRKNETKSDLTVFLELMNNLGYNSVEVPVSCWMPNCTNANQSDSTSSGIKINSDGSIDCPSNFPYPTGFGGAMGPGQFIPNTWNSIVDDIAKYTGHVFPNPWNFEDALTASAIYLYKKGARSNGEGEYTAAGKYYGCSSVSIKYKTCFYPNQVQTKTWCMQQYIDYGSMSSSCESIIFP